MAEAIIVPNLPWMIGGGMLLGAFAIASYILTTWLRIKHGYPLETSWGTQVKPITGGETIERVRLLSQENAQLRAELGSIKDRLATIERIVTDESHSLTREIEGLRGRTN